MVTTTDEEGLVTGYRGRMLVVLVLGTATAMTGRLVLSPLLPRIIDDLSLTPSSAGVALSLMWALDAAGQYPGGRLSDELSRKTVLVAGLAVSLLGAALFPGSTTYLVFISAAATIGLGMGLYLPAVFAQLSDLYVARRGQAFGLNSAAVNMGGVAAAGLATVVLAVSGWRAAFLPVVAVLSVVLLLVHRWNRTPYVVSRVAMDVRGTVGRLLMLPGVRLLLVAAVLNAFVWQATASFLPTFLQVEKGFSPELAGTAFAALFLIGVVVNPLSGGIGDRFSYPGVAAAATTCGTVGLILAIVATRTPVVLGGVGLLAVGLAGFWPALNAQLMGSLPEGSRGGDFGAIRTVYLLVGSSGPAFVGLVAERATYTAGFTGLVVSLAASVVITLWVARFGT